MDTALRVARYRLSVTFGRQWGGLLALILLVGLVGGLALGSIAAARRTQSSFPAYVATLNPSNLTGPTSVYTPGGPALAGYDASLIVGIARLPGVHRVENAVGINTLLLDRHDAPKTIPAIPPQSGESVASLNGFGLDVDRFSVIDGHAPDPNDPRQVIMTADSARTYGLRIGETARFGVYTDAQTELRGFGTAEVPPVRIVNARLVAIVEQPSQLVEDDADVSSNGNLVVFMPALGRQLLGCCTYFTETGVSVNGGATNAVAVQREILRRFPLAPPLQANPTQAVEDKAERAIRPESIALGVFGAICGLAALLIGAQMIGRQLRLGVRERLTLRALGADRSTTLVDGLLGLTGAVVIGAVLAGLFAIGISPLAPLGPVRPVDPSPGLSFDWTVLGVGVLAMVVVLMAVAVAVAHRLAPHRASYGFRPNRRSAVAGAAASTGLPESALTGIRFALEPGVGGDAVPVRSAILGAALAILVVVSTVTFGSSLNTLVSQPALYGWNWTYELTANQGADIPAHLITPLLARDTSVAATSGVYFAVLDVDGQPLPVIASSPGAAVEPPVLTGHRFESADEVVLGQTTLNQLHKQIGDTVTVGGSGTNRATLTIVGTATMPTIVNGGTQHTEMGTGALLSSSLLTAEALAGYGPPSQAGPQAILVRIRAGADQSTALRRLQRIAAAATTQFDNGVTVNTVQRPAEIVNYRSMGSIPAILGAGLAIGAVAALSLTLIASVRRRRRELALMKTLGFIHRQLATTVSCQSMVSVLIGAVVGVPLGVTVGRQLWVLFAHEINVVPVPTVPVGTIVLITIGALILANVVAVVPGWIAARTPTTTLLRQH